MKTEVELRPICPDCKKTRMRKAGPGISGRKEYQRYQCKDNKCLRTWLNTKEPFIREPTISSKNN